MQTRLITTALRGEISSGISPTVIRGRNRLGSGIGEGSAVVTRLGIRPWISGLAIDTRGNMHGTSETLWWPSSYMSPYR